MALDGRHPTDVAPAEQMLALLNGHCLEQGLYVAAMLGIADLLDNGPKSADELATATGTDRQSLYRLLRALASIGVFREEPTGNFGLTSLGVTLQADAPNSVRDRAIFYGAASMWGVWSQLLHSVKTGQSACEHVHGMPFYEYASHHPDIGAPFNRYMSKMSEMHNAAILESYDFSDIRKICDVGGGLGTTLAAILHRYPTLKGILFDRLAVVEQTQVLRTAGVAGRCDVIGGDMHQAVPDGADAYLIKRVMMDQSDEQAVAILTNCREAMTTDGRILLVETLIPQEGGPSFSKVLDVQMLLLFGRGRIRTQDEYRDLLAASGLTMTRALATGSPNTIIEARQSV
jgi:hypothetical protein